MLQEVASVPALTTEEADTLARGLEGDEGGVTRDRMIRGLMHVVVNKAAKFTHRGVPLWELIEVGAIALRRTVERLHPLQVCRVRTLAAWKVRRAMGKLVAKVAIRNVEMSPPPAVGRVQTTSRPKLL